MRDKQHQDPLAVANVETWDGSSWTEVGNLNATEHSCLGMSGDSGSALFFGGAGPSTPTKFSNNRRMGWF